MSLRDRWSKAHRSIKILLIPVTFRVSTWLTIGAALQVLSMFCFPRNVSALAPILLLVYRLGRSTIESRHIYSTSYTNVRRGRWVTRLPPAEKCDGIDDDGVVIFMLAARMNHPQGRFVASGFPLARAFSEMWSEAENHRSEWGYLGRTNTLADILDEEGQTFIWISYWKDPKGLHEFSRCAVHQRVEKWYKNDKFPHMGIMHETYFAPRNSTETIYHNFPPFGMASTRFPVQRKESFKLLDPYVPDRPGGSTMFQRMGRT